MAKNPMQKKAQASFISGMLIMLVIMGLVVALLLFQIKNLKDEANKIKASLVQVYILNTDVTSGQTIDASMLTKKQTYSNSIPSGAITIAELTEKTIAKIDLNKGTVITQSMITESDEVTDNTLRVQEYNMLRISSQIATGDYIDVRLRMPSGADYIVVSKKKVEVPTIDGIDSLNTIWIKLTEDETIAMSNAIVEAYQCEGAILYTTKFAEPGMQGILTPTYVPSASVVNLITQNPNITSEARQAMFNRYNSYTSIRDSINGELNLIEQDDKTGNLNSNVEKEIETATEQRQLYLDSLAGY